ncbi:MAG TPA: alpha/beta hydrolase family protein [Kofleriaceae bacterium]|nr:alpha/beta hydrolase family protein [Kofleriaceae bacterium]
MKRLLILLAACSLAACSSSSTTPPASKPAPTTPSATTAAPGSAATAPAHEGTVSERTFHSAALGVDKTYLVYLPEGYASSQKRYPVFYYLHGLTGDERSWIKGGHLDAAADQLGLEAIVVTPDGDDGFYTDSVTPVDYDACMKDGTGLFLPQFQHHDKTCVHQRNYETYIVKDLVADVDAQYRTIAKREGRGLAGMSMGGLGAFELAMRHPDEFSAAASHSGVVALLYAGPHPYGTGLVKLVTDVSTWGRTGDPSVNHIGEWVRALFGPDIANWKAHDPAFLLQKLEPGKLALYLDAGTEDEFGLDAQAAYVDELLSARKIEHVYFSGPGHHDFGFWIPRLPKSLAFLRDHLAKPQG